MIGRYFDYNATTPLHEEVIQLMTEEMSVFGNPSSTHHFGQTAKRKTIHAKEQVCKLIGAEPSQLIFTSGGSESNNLAIKGWIEKLNVSKGHLITSQIEHPATLKVFQHLEEKGFDVSYLPVSMEGFVEKSCLLKALRHDTLLVSIMLANNETGTIQPINDMVETVKSYNPLILFHTDAVQAVGKMVVNINNLGVDALSFSAHKIYGPKGIGALYLKDPYTISPLVHGGGQEFGLRNGTENVLAILGFGKTCDILRCNLHSEITHYLLMKKMMFESIQSIRDVQLNGVNDMNFSLPNTLNLSFKGIRAEALAAILNEMFGIAVSIGSACSADKTHLSHVLKASGISDEQIKSSLRISWGRYTTVNDIEYLVRGLETTISKLRNMLPKVVQEA